MLHRNAWIVIVITMLVIVACATKPYKLSNKSYKAQTKQLAYTLQQLPIVMSNDSLLAPPFFVGTTNFNLRKPSFVIIHHTAQNSCEQTLKTFTLTRTQVSAHYVICKEGIVYHLLNDYLRAWHAGISSWGNITDINSCSIGIELDNNGSEPFTEAQIKSLISLLRKLKNDYTISTANFIGHGDIAPTRKNDPSILFPWETLAQQGFGNWYDSSAEIIPANFNALQGLRLIGYSIKDSTAAIASFKRHFMQDTVKVLNEKDKRVIYNLMKKY